MMLKANAEFINKSYRTFKIICIITSTFVTPIVFICALYQSLPDDAKFADMLEMPAFLEVLIGGVIFGVG